jgi:hypothetical protein
MEQARMEAALLRPRIHLYLLHDPKCLPNSRAQSGVSQQHRHDEVANVRYIGYLATHERFFLGLDTLPLFLGITVYTYFWPGRYLRYDLKKEEIEMERASQAGSATALQHGAVEEPKLTGPTVV